MRSAKVRVVDDDHVAGLELVQAVRLPLDDVTHRRLHHTHEQRQPASALHDQLTIVSSIDAIRAVHRLGDDGRERRLLLGEIHLACDHDEAVVDDGERDGIELHAFA